MSNNFYYESGPLSKYEPYKEKMRTISRAVKKERGIESLSLSKIDIPQDSWFKIYHANVVFDNDDFIGFSLTSDSHDFLNNSYWIDFKIWLIKNNYNINKIGATFAYYIDPKYWKMGVTQDLVRHSFKNDNYDYMLSFRFATKEFCHWYENTFSEEFDLIDTGFRCPNGTKTFLSKVNNNIDD